VFGRFQEFEPQMQTVHSLNELEIIPHSRLKLSSYVHSKSQFTKKKFKKNHKFFYFHHFICGSLLLGIRGGYKSGKTKKMNHNEADGFLSASFISYLTKSSTYNNFFDFNYP